METITGRSNTLDALIAQWDRMCPDGDVHDRFDARMTYSVTLIALALDGYDVKRRTR